MPAPELPAEVILHICSWLPPHRHCLLPLLTINRHWHRVIVTKLYTTISIRSVADQYHYLNLFRETRRARHHGHDHFYSDTHYAGYVRCLDLSYSYPGKEISDQVLLDLTRDCTALERLNIYNCHMISSNGLMAVLQQCPTLRHLHCAMATRLTAKAFAVIGQQQRLLTLNIHGLSPSYFFKKYKTLPSSLTSLSATSWFPSPSLSPLPCLRQLKLDTLQHWTVPRAVLEALPHLTHLSLKQATIVDALPYTTLDTLELNRCWVDPSVPAVVATHLHLPHTAIRHRQWLHPRLVSLTTPPNTSPEDLLGALSLAEHDCRLRHLTITHSPELANHSIPPAILANLVSLDTDVDVMMPVPNNHLTDLRMRAQECHWSLDTISEAFPFLQVLFWAPELDQLRVNLDTWADRLENLRGLMISALYYREPTPRLVALRQEYQHVELANVI